MLLGTIDCTRSNGASILCPSSNGNGTAGAESCFVMKTNRVKERSSSVNAPKDIHTDETYQTLQDKTQ